MGQGSLQFHSAPSTTGRPVAGRRFLRGCLGRWLGLAQGPDIVSQGGNVHGQTAQDLPGSSFHVEDPEEKIVRAGQRPQPLKGQSSRPLDCPCRPSRVGRYGRAQRFGPPDGFDDLGSSAFGSGAGPAQNLCRGIGGLGHEPEQEMLRTEVSVTELSGLGSGVLQHPLDSLVEAVVRAVGHGAKVDDQGARRRCTRRATDRLVAGRPAGEETWTTELAVLMLQLLQPRT
jgi:hypothetical protein